MESLLFEIPCSNFSCLIELQGASASVQSPDRNVSNLTGKADRSVPKPESPMASPISDDVAKGGSPAKVLSRESAGNHENATFQGGASEEAIVAPHMQGLWDEGDIDVQEPWRESSTEVDQASWQDRKQKLDLEEVERTTRQEDTELGIFRPDEL